MERQGEKLLQIAKKGETGRNKEKEGWCMT
jgi:hypothetical protein